MLRLRPTTLSLTIEEVKSYEHRRKYWKFLVEHDKCRGRVTGDVRDTTGSSLGGGTTSPPPSPSQFGKAVAISLSAHVHEPPALSLSQSPTDTRAEHRGMLEPADSDNDDDDSNDGDSFMPRMTRPLAMPPRRPLPARTPLPQTDAGTGRGAPPGPSDGRELESSRLPLSRVASAEMLDSISTVASVGGRLNDEHDAVPEQTPKRGGLISLQQGHAVSTAQHYSLMQDEDHPQRPDDEGGTEYAGWRIDPVKGRLHSSTIDGPESVTLPSQVYESPQGRQSRRRSDSRGPKSPEARSSGNDSLSSMEQLSGLVKGESEPGHEDIFNTDRPSFHVYDDSQPASSQPQTPQNLPEARHRSRITGAFTAPPAGTNSARRPATRTLRSSRRWALRRSPSPEGLNTPGFQGLYGGLENSDDATLFEQAMRRIGRLRRSGASAGQQSSA